MNMANVMIMMMRSDDRARRRRFFSIYFSLLFLALLFFIVTGRIFSSIFFSIHSLDVRCRFISISEINGCQLHYYDDGQQHDDVLNKFFAEHIFQWHQMMKIT